MRFGGKENAKVKLVESKASNTQGCGRCGWGFGWECWLFGLGCQVNSWYEGGGVIIMFEELVMAWKEDGFDVVIEKFFV